MPLMLTRNFMAAAIWLERQRSRADAWYTGWEILYEFARVQPIHTSCDGRGPHRRPSNSSWHCLLLQAIYLSRGHGSAAILAIAAGDAKTAHFILFAIQVA
jgi:hypothetical protein